jgi:hypothetical protein
MLSTAPGAGDTAAGTVLMQHLEGAWMLDDNVVPLGTILVAENDGVACGY